MPGLVSRISIHQYNQIERILIQLPAAETVQKLVTIFFDEANWYFSVLDRYYFDQVYQQWFRTWIEVARTGSSMCVTAEVLYFPALLFQVVAIALQFVPPSLAEREDIALLAHPSFEYKSSTYSGAGQAIMNLLGRRIRSLTAIEADLMRCAWLKNSGEGAEAWYILGNAVR